MSSFKCEHCGTDCIDTEHGYTTGCEHYPADIPRLTDEQCVAVFHDMNENNRFALLRATFAVGYAEGNKHTDYSKKPKFTTENNKEAANVLKANAKLKRREAIAVKALQDLNKHYNTILRDAPWPTAAFHIVKTALSKIEGDSL